MTKQELYFSFLYLLTKVLFLQLKSLKFDLSKKITFLHCSTVCAALYLHHFLRLRRSVMLSSGFFVARCKLSFFFFISLVIVDRLTWSALIVAFRSEAISAMLMFGLHLASTITLFSSFFDIFLGQLEQLLPSTVPKSL